jgi:hypothetical protein
MNLRSRVSIFDTLTTRTTINKVQLRELVNFIVLNRGYRLNATEVKTLVGAKSLAVTAISSLFARAIELHKESLFSFMRIPASVTTMPEVVTYRHVAFDLKQLATSTDTTGLYETLKVVPDITNTIFENVTPLLRGSGELVDTLAFQSTIVRDLLVRSYYENKATVWLTPSLLRYLCRFYNMSMSSVIGSIYNLTFSEQQAVAAVFSLYFLQLVSDTDTAEVMVKTQKLGLGAPDKLADVISRLKDTLGSRYDAMTLDDVCTGVNSLGIGRLEGIDRKFIYTRQRNIGPDALTSAMAIEYPPYWCYLVLTALSGRKMGLQNTLKRNDLGRDAPGFADDLLKSQSFLPSL